MQQKWKIILFQLKNKAALAQAYPPWPSLIKTDSEMGGQGRLEKESKKRLPSSEYWHKEKDVAKI